MEKDVYAVLRLEAEEKEMQQSEAQVRRGGRPHPCCSEVAALLTWQWLLQPHQCPCANPTDRHSKAALGEGEGDSRPGA